MYLHLLQVGKDINSHHFKAGQAGIFMLLGVIVMYLSFKENTGAC
eukprot:COSAG06_NODE_19603_length_831_cov_0.823770_1_plen_45_part_00